MAQVKRKLDGDNDNVPLTDLSYAPIGSQEAC